MRAVIDELEGGLTRRRLALAGGSAGGVAVLAFWLGLRTASVDVCEEGEARLAGAWDRTVAGELQAAFAATGQSQAAASADATSRVLDEYADAWLVMYREACEATHRRGEQSTDLLDRRMLCLDRRRERLAALTNALRTADTATLEHAVEVASGLDSVAPCADVAGLLAAPARDVTPEHLAIERELADVDVAWRLRNAGDTRPRLEALREAAEAANASHLEARALNLDALVAMQAGEFRVAEPLLYRALAAGELADDDEQRALSLTLLVQIEGLDLARFERAGQLAAVAEALLERVPSGEPHATFAYVSTLVMSDAGRWDDALAHAEQFLKLRSAEFGAQSMRTAAAHVSLAVVLGQTGSEVAAEAEFERALAIFEATLGSDHPRVANVLGNLGVSAIRRRDYDRAEQLVDRALEIYRAWYGDDHPETATTRLNVGGLALRRGRPRDAFDHFSAAVAARTRLFGADHPSTANAVADLAEAEVELGDLESARRHAEAARRVLSDSMRRPDESTHAEFVLARALAREHPQQALALARGALQRLPAELRYEDLRAQILAWMATQLGAP
jgi:tetratricopeptide (TPR) repeat protein